MSDFDEFEVFRALVTLARNDDRYAMASTPAVRKDCMNGFVAEVAQIFQIDEATVRRVVSGIASEHVEESQRSPRFEAAAFANGR